MQAHRVAWEMAHGPIPLGLEVLHRCDRPWCVRPDHLNLGTHQDNMHDMARKGRSTASDGRGRGSVSRLPASERSDGLYRRALELRARHLGRQPPGVDLECLGGERRRVGGSQERLFDLDALG